MENVDRIERKIEELRIHSTGGGLITLHRAIATLPLGWRNMLGALLLPAIFTLVLMLTLDDILGGWNALYAFWGTRLGLGNVVGTLHIDLGHYMLVLGHPNLQATYPTTFHWWACLVVCVLLWIATHALRPDRLLPVIYICRACLLIQGSALLYLFFFPGQLRYDLSGYLADAMTMALFFVFLVPWILGLTYNIFDFPLTQKVALNLLAIAYFLVALPMQYMLHAVLLHWFGMLYLPLFYLAFGVFLDVMMFVALYAWGMSWRWHARDAH